VEKIKRMSLKRVIAMIFITVFTSVNILSTNCFAADAPEDQWKNFFSAYINVEDFWYSNFGYAYSVDPEALCAGYYGKHVSAKSQVTDSVDYIARTIFGEICDVYPRVNNAFAVAQTIENRVNRNYASSAKKVCEKVAWYQATGKRAWLWPSNRTYGPEPEISQEELFVHCLFLAECLYYEEPIPTKHKQWCFPVVTDIGTRIHFYHVKTGDCPFYLSNGTQCSPYNVVNAVRYYNYPLKQTVISGGGYHVYYDYDGK